MSLFRVSSDCAEIGLRAGAILFRGVQIRDSPAGLCAEISTGIDQVQSEFESMSEVRTSREVAAFRELLKTVGAPPKQKPPSVETLLRRALKQRSLRQINNFVDAYNLVSLLTRCSLGAHDLDRIAPPVELCFFRGDELFIPLGSDEQQDVPATEFGYLDAERKVLCRLDVIQAEFSKVTPATANALLIVEGTASHSRETLQRAFDMCCEIIPRYCGGEAKIVAFPSELT